MTGPLRIRHGIRVYGVVQGVGFRPAVHRLATANGLAGLVRNDALGVWIEVEGGESQVKRFPIDLNDGAPPLARIDRVEITELPASHADGFQVVASEASASGAAAIPADAATCDACLRELRDPQNRRFRYPFLNCTDCGPRFTIVRELPYDRPKTTMDAFAQCEDCRREYHDPANRRFHAEPNACPRCGPRVELWREGHGEVSGDKAVRAAVALVEGGGIVAVKGLGGFFLAVDARNDAAVRRLRVRKLRPHKPFAVMARDLGEAARVAEIGPQERAALIGAQRPIMLLPMRRESGIAPSVAPGLGELGLMLPYTPLHQLLLEGGPSLWVMTSGNVSDEPIARTNDQARERLGAIADALLVHDREIHTRVDDSVLRSARGSPRMIRRARGYVPTSIALRDATEVPILAVGAEQKGAVCIARGHEAFLSQHLGDLKNPRALAFFEETIERLGRLLGVTPTVVAHDLHPDYHSTQWALRSGLRTFGVQHHHAHVASCLAEHAHPGPVLGVAFDGTGCGPRGELWGGEFLIADLRGFERHAHLRPIALAGGEAAIREVWRLGVAALRDAEVPCDAPGLERAFPRGAQPALIQRLLGREAYAPRATGAGRWFDAIAALCGVRHQVSYEGQAAVELEAICARDPEPAYPVVLIRHQNGPWEIDLRPTVRGVVADLRGAIEPARISARFHETLAQAISLVASHVRAERGLSTVALSGGCFQNRRLLERAAALLEADGFEVLLHRDVPPNDGGIALGQAAIAAHQLHSTDGGRDVSRDSR